MKHDMRLFPLLFSLFFFVTVLHIPAQEEPLGVVEYLDAPFEALVITPDGAEVEPYIGLELGGGVTIRTWESTVEIRLVSNGSILRVAENTVFRLEPGRTGNGQSINAFSLAAGTLRCIAARAAGQSYAVHTQTAVMGVRGTDFIVSAEPDAYALSVLDGAVETLYRGNGRSVLVKAGFSQDLADEAAEPKVLDEDVRELLADMNSFKNLDPLTVPHQDDYSSTFSLVEEAGLVPAEGLQRIKERAAPEADTPLSKPPSGRDVQQTPGKDGPAAAEDAAGASSRERVSRERRSTSDGDFPFVLTAALHPELVQIAESTWTQVLGMGFGGSVSLTAGLAETPGFFAGLTGGVYHLSGKPAGGLESSLWVPAGFLAGIRAPLAPPLSFYAAGEGGMQFTRMTYADTGLGSIEGWSPYVLGRLGIRYDLSPLVLEAGAAFGTVIDATAIPFARVVLGVVYEVEL